MHARFPTILLGLTLILGCGTQASERHDATLVGSPHATASTAPSARPALRGALWYQLRVQADKLRVLMRLWRPPERASFFLPGSWAGHSNLASAIDLVDARGPQGHRNVTLHRHEGRIDVDGHNQPWIELHYEVKLSPRRDEGQRFLPQRLGAGFFAYGPSFLVVPSEHLARQLRQIPIEVHSPETWGVVSTWPRPRAPAASVRPGIAVHGFLVDDVRQLRDAFIAASDNLNPRPDKADETQVIFEATFRGERQRMREAIVAIVADYRRRFGALGPTRVLVRAPRGLRGNHIWGTGRRGGFVLELPARAKLDAEVLVLIAHEALHLWNGHHLVPKPSQERDTRWFKEGLTHYVAIRTLLELGLVGHRQALDWVADYTTSYHRRPQPSRLPYDRGLLLALSIDDDLQRSGVPRGLDAWLRLLLAHDDRGHYDRSTLQTTLFSLSDDARLQRRWAKWVQRGERIDAKSVFEGLGLHYLAPIGRRKAKLVPLQKGTGRYRALWP